LAIPRPPTIRIRFRKECTILLKFKFLNVFEISVNREVESPPFWSELQSDSAIELSAEDRHHEWHGDSITFLPSSPIGILTGGQREIDHPPQVVEDIVGRHLFLARGYTSSEREAKRVEHQLTFRLTGFGRKSKVAQPAYSNVPRAP
jgi:hypothetical protein